MPNTFFAPISRPTLALLFALPLALGLGDSAVAGPGHDHGDEAPAATAGGAAPRFSAVSDGFELVGVLSDRRHLVVYLDRFDDNVPVEGARVELDINGTAIAAIAKAPGQYEADLPQPLTDGVTAVTTTVTSGSRTALLVAELDLHDDRDAAPAATSPWARFGRPAVIGTVALLAAVVVATVLRRRRNLSRIGPNGSGAEYSR